MGELMKNFQPKKIVQYGVDKVSEDLKSNQIKRT
jgi:hypothetical protein